MDIESKVTPISGEYTGIQRQRTYSIVATQSLDESLYSGRVDCDYQFTYAGDESSVVVMNEGKEGTNQHTWGQKSQRMTNYLFFVPGFSKCEVIYSIDPR